VSGSLLITASIVANGSLLDYCIHHATWFTLRIMHSSMNLVHTTNVVLVTTILVHSASMHSSGCLGSLSVAVVIQILGSLLCGEIIRVLGSLSVSAFIVAIDSLLVYDQFELRGSL
jgi:hypothetical protein